jgi:hypothetical protein
LSIVEVSVTVESSKKMCDIPESVAICTKYFIDAGAALFHTSGTLSAWILAVSGGLISITGPGGPITVIKVDVVDQPLVPATFVAFTHQ